MTRSATLVQRPQRSLPQNVPLSIQPHDWTGRTHSGRVMSESGLSGPTGEFFVLAEALRAFKIGPLSDNPSDRALAKAAGVSPTTIGDWLRGKHFPQDISKVLIVVRMVRDAAVGRGIASPGSGPAGLLDDNRWRAAHQESARTDSATPFPGRPNRDYEKA